MKNIERIIWATIVVLITLLGPVAGHAEWDWTDTGLFRDALQKMERQTKAEESMAKSLEAMAKNCKN